MHRRRFVQVLGLAGIATQTAPWKGAGAAASVIKPRRLAPGDTVALVSPASATFQSIDVQVATESLEALGLKVRLGEHLLDRHGYLAGEDKARAADINALFADRSVAAIHPIRGGWGSSRLLPYLDFDVIRRNPEDPARLQRHHGAAALDSRQDRPRDVPRADRDGAMGHVLGRLLPPRAAERRARHV